MFAPGKDKSLGAVKLPQPHSSRKSWGEAPPRAGSTWQPPWAQEILAARAAAGDDSLVPSQLARAGGTHSL